MQELICMQQCATYCVNPVCCYKAVASMMPVFKASFQERLGELQDGKFDACTEKNNRSYKSKKISGQAVGRTNKNITVTLTKFCLVNVLEGG